MRGMDRLCSLQDAGYGGPLQLLQTLPGIDLMGAVMLLVEIGSDMSVFFSAQRLASWVGMCPGNNESAGKRKSGRIRGRATPGYADCCASLHRQPLEVAARSKTDSRRSTCARATSDPLWRWGPKCCAQFTRCSPKTPATYVDKTVDYEALMVARNAPRWLQMLVKHGFVPRPSLRPTDNALGSNGESIAYLVSWVKLRT